MRRLHWILLALWVSAAGVVSAQDLREVRFRVIAFELWSDVTEVAFVGMEGQEVEVPLSKLSFSEEYTAMVGSRLSFFVPGSSPEPMTAGGEPTRPSVGSVSLVRNSNEFILVFVPVEVDGRRFYRIQPIISEDSVFSQGGIMFINLSEYAMVAKIGEEKLKLGVRSPSLVPYMGDGNRFDGKIQVAVYLENNWRMFYSSQWTIPKRSKTVVMIYKNEKSGMPLLRSVSYRL